MAESSTDTQQKCGLCLQATARYTCPKCSLHYCSLTCYRSEGHASCSENFYKQCVEEELHVRVKDEGDQASRRKMEEILWRLAQEEEKMDSDDLEESDDDLEERMKNVNLNSPVDIWEKLTDKEKKEFEELVESGRITELLPPFEPWWITEAIPLIEEVDLNDEKLTKIPKVKENIPLLSTMMGKKPSDKVIFGLMNILYGYCAATRLFTTELEEEGSAQKVMETMLKISANLSQGRNFDSAVDAVEYARVAACREANVSPDLCSTVKSDVAKIMEHKSFILSALSHVYNLFDKAKSQGATKRQTFLATKKIEFYLSYITEFGYQFVI